MSEPRICQTCGLPVPRRMVHEPSTQPNGEPGVYLCRWMAIDDKGKTWRDYARPRDDDEAAAS